MGGAEIVAKLTGATTQSVYQWASRGRVTRAYYFAFVDAAKKLGVALDVKRALNGDDPQ